MASEIPLRPPGDGAKITQLRAQEAGSASNGSGYRKGTGCRKGTVKACVTIHVETLWTNRAELSIEAELDNPHSKTNQEIVSMMFEAARLMASEARGENERALFSQEAMNSRHREMDEREARMDERDKRLTSREEGAHDRDEQADRREDQADVRERDQMERDVRLERQEQ